MDHVDYLELVHIGNELLHKHEHELIGVYFNDGYIEFQLSADALEQLFDADDLEWNLHYDEVPPGREQLYDASMDNGKVTVFALFSEREAQRLGCPLAGDGQ